MELARSIENIAPIFKQYKKETGETNFNLNNLIKWLGNRKVVTIDE